MGAWAALSMSTCACPSMSELIVCLSSEQVREMTRTQYVSTSCCPCSWLGASGAVNRVAERPQSRCSSCKYRGIVPARGWAARLVIGRHTGGGGFVAEVKRAADDADLVRCQITTQALFHTVDVQHSLQLRAPEDALRRRYSVTKSVSRSGRLRPWVSSTGSTCVSQMMPSATHVVFFARVAAQAACTPRASSIAVSCVDQQITCHPHLPFSHFFASVPPRVRAPEGALRPHHMSPSVLQHNVMLTGSSPGGVYNTFQPLQRQLACTHS